MGDRSWSSLAFGSDGSFSLFYFRVWKKRPGPGERSGNYRAASFSPPRSTNSTHTNYSHTSSHRISWFWDFTRRRRYSGHLSSRFASPKTGAITKYHPEPRIKYGVNSEKDLIHSFLTKIVLIGHHFVQIQYVPRSLITLSKFLFFGADFGKVGVFLQHFRNFNRSICSLKIF